MITKGSAFEERLTRRTVAAQQFHATDAKNILHMTARARSRVISEVQAGQLVYYFRRGKKTSDHGYKGPAKVIAVEKRAKWSAHGRLAKSCWHPDQSGA